jgi:hypothetical protein
MNACARALDALVYEPMRMPVLAVGVTVVSVLVGMIVGMGVPLGHALRAPHRQSEMAVRPGVGMAVHTPAVPVGIGIGARGDA